MGATNVVVKVTVPGATSISVTRTGGGCGTLAAATGASPLTLTGKAADNGYCDLTATATLSGGGTRGAGRALRSPGVQSGPAAGHAGGRHLRAPAVSAGRRTRRCDRDHRHQRTAGLRQRRLRDVHRWSTTGRGRSRRCWCRCPATKVTSACRPRTVNGVRHVHAEVRRGFFRNDERHARPCASGPRMQQAVNAGSLDLGVTLEDELGAIGDVFGLHLQPQEVGAGEVKVSIAWDTPTDVDLHVIEPSGEEIDYFEIPSPPPAATLDLDSNAACGIDGINNENVSWPLGQSPNGNFTVRVHMFESLCGDPPGPAYASGTVTMTYCGDDSPKVLPFFLAGEDASQTFTFKSQCKLRVSGKVRYEDFPITDTGLGAERDGAGPVCARAGLAQQAERRRHHRRRRHRCLGQVRHHVRERRSGEPRLLRPGRRPAGQRDAETGRQEPEQRHLRVPLAQGQRAAARQQQPAGRQEGLQGRHRRQEGRRRRRAEHLRRRRRFGGFRPQSHRQDAADAHVEVDVRRRSLRTGTCRSTPRRMRPSS